MPIQPTLTTERLLLRPLTLADAPEVQRLAGAREIAATTATIPHPYPDGAAESWIETHAVRFDRGEAAVFAVTRRADNALLGVVGLEIDAGMQRAELGYWIGKPYWNLGYCSEAATALVRFALAGLGLRRVFARHFSGNPASGRVMQKIGMRHEGTLRRHIVKWGEVHNLEIYGLLAGEPIGAPDTRDS
ncbi:MAG: GNAT family N-acetyltransferase [Chloroflexi bacterium]|nr:GNAT family N-acetyltransferase [Chloroflexota bacterium]